MTNQGGAAAPESMNQRLGDHLRRLRKQRGLSLLDVQAQSLDEFKASVLGAYERGERAISALRLARLAELYRLPMQAMLPPDGVMGESPTGGLAIDTERLDGATSAEGAIVSRFVARLQARRRDWTGTVFKMRSEDVIALASAVDKTPAELVALLDELGLRAHA
jgi:transcriptional regulator with XRE-family HTH domain